MITSQDNELPEGFKMTELGSLPDYWEVERLIDVAISDSDIVGGPFGSNLKVCDYKDSGIPVIRLQNVERNRFINKDIKFISKEKAAELKYHSFSAGDIVLAKLGDPIGKTCIVPNELAEGIVVADVVRIRTSPVLTHKEYVVYALNTNFCEEQFRKQKTGTTRPRVNVSNVRNIFIPIPPIAEQKGIAHVLSTIQRAVEAQDKLIAAARQLKKSLMRHLFTYGPVPLSQAEHVPLKETEIGPIPDHWEAVRMGEVALAVGSGLTPRGGRQTYLQKGITFIRSQNVEMNRLSLQDVAFISPEVHESMSRSAITSGDVLLNITGASIGRVACVPEDLKAANVNQHVCKIRLKESALPEFVSYFLSSSAGQFQIMGTQFGTTRQGLNYGQVRALQLPLPPLPEQQQIASILSAVDQKIEAEQNRKAALQTLFQTMLHLLMTGKVRVKEQITS